ncbi:hypothetical protein [uncultured Microbacterium sp.]|uniref:hypothetical protein n=1 Tax=uncultured Microbacterium sp. TaxID=191216 RepID=UPI0025F8130E|nr:hypothetical protein [uncultured Microbacterium sp.]
MDERPRTSGETVRRAGLGVGLAVGMAAGVALAAGLGNAGAGIAAGLVIGSAVMVLFTVAGARRDREDARRRASDDDASRVDRGPENAAEPAPGKVDRADPDHGDPGQDPVIPG